MVIDRKVWRIEMGLLLEEGWYVARYPRNGGVPQFLHQDGEWRDSAVQEIDGQRLLSGYYSDVGLAAEAIAKYEES